jgi:AAA domain (Cdc48 subfamily)
MSEFSAEHSDQRLVGAPPGYLGYDVGGELTNAIREKPFCLVLFDEIEKTHPRILDKFLQILDDGVLTSGRGDRENVALMGPPCACNKIAQGIRLVERLSPEIVTPSALREPNSRKLDDVVDGRQSTIRRPGIGRNAPTAQRIEQPWNQIPACAPGPSERTG